MPIYEYECEACGVRFERLQRIADKPLSVCPECDGRVYRVLHPVGVIFKGSGFYVTDHRAPSPTAVPGESHSNGKAAEKKPSESKSEAAKEAE